MDCTDFFVSSASLPTSSPTTAKPLPASLALAASLDAFSASKWLDQQFLEKI